MVDITRNENSQQHNPEYTVVDSMHEDKPFYIPWQLDDMPLSDAEFRIYFHLRRVGWKTTACWKTINHLANDLGKKRHTIIAALDRLVSLGMLSREPYPNHKQRVLYRLLPMRRWQKPVSEGAPEPVSEGAPVSQTGVPKGTGPVSQGAPVQLSRKGSERKKEPFLSEGCEGPSGPRVTPREPTPGSAVWNAYSDGMRRRWRIDPPRNAKTASQCKQLVELVGIDNAMTLARAYPERVDKWYVEKGHPIGLLLTDYPKLLRDLALGFKVTREMATSLERTFDGAQAMTLAEQGVMPVAIGTTQHEALPAFDEALV